MVLWIGQVCFLTLAAWYFFGDSWWWLAPSAAYVGLRLKWRFRADATDFITYRRTPYSVARLLYFLTALVLAVYVYLQASTEGTSATVFAILALGWIVVMRLMTPIDLAVPMGGRAEVPYFRAPDKRERVEQPRRTAPVVLLVYAGRLAGLLILFSTVTAFSVAQGWLSAPVGVTGTPAVLARSADVYAWQAADALPVLEVPDTVRWVQAPGFGDTPALILLLFFKVFVLLPIATSLVYLLRSLWERRPIMAETLEDGPPVPWTRQTGGFQEYQIRRALYKAQARERIEHMRDERRQTAAQLNGMTVEDICERSQTAIDAARAGAQLAKSATFIAALNYNPALRDALLDYSTRYAVFANVIEGDLRRRRLRSNANGGRPPSVEELAEYQARAAAALVGVVRVTTELHALSSETLELLGVSGTSEPAPAS